MSSRLPPNAIDLARELRDIHAEEREAYYERTGVPTTLRAAVEAILSVSIQRSVSQDEIVLPAREVETRTGQPAVIGRYNVIRLLGRGGMGEVYLAHDPVLDREVAVKLIGAGIDNANARRRLVEEARAAGRLRHPNIVTIFDAGEHEGNPYIAMEYVVGETLRSLIERRAPFSQGRKLALMQDACAGLAHAHRANVVHFDVKPDNLMVDSRNGLKVVDFGVARVINSEALVTQHVAGTLRYMSPEQLTGKPLDRRSDVFSLGCSLFEFIAYEPAYLGTVSEIMTRITSGPVPHLAELVPWVHPTLDALIAKAMAIDPAHRFDDLDELARSLRRVREELDPLDEPWTTSHSSVASVAPPRRGTAPVVARPKRMTFAISGIVFALVVGSGAVWMWRSSAVVAPEEASRSLPEPSRAPEPAPADQTPTSAATSPPPAVGTGAPAPSTTSVRPNASSTPPVASPQRQARNDARAEPQVETVRPTAQPPAIEPPAPLAPAPPPTPEAAANVSPPTALPSTTEPKPIDEASEVLGALRRYRDAYAALDVAAVQRIYPTLGANQVEQLRKTFESTTTYEIAVTQPRVDMRSNTATVRTLVSRKIVPKVGSPQSNAVETEFQLRRDEHGWVITEVRANR